MDITVKKSELEHLLKPDVEFYKMDPCAYLPTKSNPHDAGYDLYTLNDVTLLPQSFTDVATGISIKMPPRGTHWARITGRSSTVRNWRLQVQEGVIDSGYTGELFIGVWNLRSGPILVPAYTRLAQVIFQINVDVNWTASDEPLQGERGDKGFGSSGK